MLKINIYREVNHLCTAKCASLFWVSITKRNAGVKIQWRWSLKTLFSLLLVGDTSVFSTNKYALLTRNVFSIEAVKVADIETKISVYVHEHDSCFKIISQTDATPAWKKNHYFMFSPPLNYQINHPGHSYACNMSHDTDARSWLKNIL